MITVRTEGLGPIGCLLTLAIWLYCVASGAAYLFFAHEAWHAYPDPNVGNLLIDFVLSPFVRAVLWPFFI